MSTSFFFAKDTELFIYSGDPTYMMFMLKVAFKTTSVVMSYSIDRMESSLFRRVESLTMTRKRL
jgi:hypothetical protein